MPEPTDHRAEAEKWLGYATEDDFVDVPDMTDVVASALISISHQLGAIHDALLALQGTVRTLRPPRASYPPLSPSEG